jgi:hypothetical protein
MKIYRVHTRDEFSESKGYDYFTDKSEAIKEQNKSNKDSSMKEEIEEEDIPVSKKGILYALKI